MTGTKNIILSAFKYLTTDSGYICRLCFGATNKEGADGVYLNERRLIQNQCYEDIVSYADMLQDLGASSDPSLPEMLCEHCADMAISAFLFHKLCLQSHSIWNEIVEKINKTLELSYNLSANVKSAYMIVQDEKIVTSKKYLKEKKKNVDVGQIHNLLKARKTYKNNKKTSYIICEECGEKLNSKSNLANHRRKHRNKEYPCKLCFKLFGSKLSLRDHEDRVHKPRTIQCPNCAKMFSSEKMLKYHNTLHHKAAICKHCFIQFPSRKDLLKHVDKHEAHICTRCNKKFTSKKRYTIHSKECGSIQQMQFYCDICCKSFTRKNAIRTHLITEHGFGKAHICNWCKKPFDAISKLKSHVVKHTKERNFHCDKCGGRFVTQAALVYHIRIHTGEKPFPCDMCDASFLSASRRMAHKRRKHLGPGRECPICNNKFITGYELRKHILRHRNPKSKLYVEEMV